MRDAHSPVITNGYGGINTYFRRGAMNAGGTGANTYLENSSN